MDEPWRQARRCARHAGEFFTGVLAVGRQPLHRTLYGGALGICADSARPALSIFVSLGVGMAAPMVAISMSKTARDWLPKPGVWMETLKQVMAFRSISLPSGYCGAGKQSGVDTMAAAAADWCC